MAVTPTQAPATAAGPEIKDPTLTQQLMLDAPFGDDLCVISARGTGKSWGRDAGGAGCSALEGAMQRPDQPFAGLVSL